MPVLDLPDAVDAPSACDPLLARVRSGDQAAFDELYLTHARTLWEYAYRILRNRDDAEEVVQELFAAMWERRAEWEVQGTMAAYLVRATRNRALNHVRHRHVVRDLEERAVRSDMTPGMGGHRDAIDDVVSAAQVEAVIQAAIQALPERRRIALTLRLVNHMTFSEIGEAMQISDKAAFILVSRARDTLMPLVSLLK